MMRVKVLEPPDPIITIADARRQISDLPVEDEVYVESLILAATAWIDGPAGWLGRCIGKQKLELCGWNGSERLTLPYPPATAINDVVAETDNGEEITVDPLAYRLTCGQLVMSADAGWRGQREYRVRYSSGYEHVPAPIKVAILMLVAHWYRTREAVSADAQASVPFGVEALLAPYRVYS